MDQLYGTIQQITAYSGISRSRLYELLSARIIPAKKAGRRVLIAFKDVENYLNSLPDWMDS